MKTKDFDIRKPSPAPSKELAADHSLLRNQPPKQPYKTAKEKIAYEEQVDTRIRPYLFIHSQDLSQEMRSASQLGPIEYLEELERAWKEHIQVCVDISDFLSQRHESRYPAWCLSEWKDVRSLLIEAFKTDKDKNIFSVGIKDKIEKTVSELKDKYSWDENETATCITPSTPSFHTQYNLDHMKLAMITKETEYDSEEEILAEKYHHGDVELLKLRLEKMGFEKMSEPMLRSLVDDVELKIEQQSLAKIEFIKKYPEAKAIDDLLIFDNLQEYIYVYSQAAYPDLHLREEVLNQLASLGFEIDNKEVLAYSIEDLLEKIDKAIAQIEQNYSMPVKTYNQTVTSCGVSCVMGFAHEDLTHTRDTELSLWRRSGAPYNFPGGIALILEALEYETAYVVNQAQHFKPGQHPIEDLDTDPNMADNVDTYIRLHDSAVENGMKVSISDTKFDDIVDGLKNGLASILGIHMPETPYILHWLLVHGYNSTDEGIILEISDSLGAFDSLSEKEFEQLVDTYMGKRVIYINKNRKVVKK